MKKLQEHERLPFARKTIYLALHFFDLSLRFSEQRFFKRLGVGHIRAVFGLATEQQEELLSGAEKHGWTIAEVTLRAADVRRRSRRKSGRPPATPERLLKREVHRHVVELDRLLSGSLIQSCSPERLVGLVNATHQLKNELGAWLAIQPRDDVDLERTVPPGE